MKSTFRPTSSILYLTPPKPRHIASIHTELNWIRFNQIKTIKKILKKKQKESITLEWNVIVVLKQPYNNSNNNNNSNPKQQEKTITNNNTKKRNTRQSLQSTSIAKVEEERNPLRWNIFIRRYGERERQKFAITDRENTLDPPFTGNKTYQHIIPLIYMIDDSTNIINSSKTLTRAQSPILGASYEVCIQSVNGGPMRESDQLRKDYPINAHTELSGRNNPLFICKEVLLQKSQNTDDNNDKKFDDHENNEIDFIDQNLKSDDKIKGRQLSSDNGEDGTAHIEVSKEATDAFVVYTAITSGSTTVLILIVVAAFCCCKCNQRTNMHKEYRHYNRAPSTDLPFY